MLKNKVRYILNITYSCEKNAVFYLVSMMLAFISNFNKIVLYIILNYFLHNDENLCKIESFFK